MNKFVSGVFMLMLCAWVMAFLASGFFGLSNSRSDGSLMYVARAVETPISNYYYNYCYIPTVHMEDGVDKALGGTLKASMSNYARTESNLKSADSDNVVFSGTNHYSTGWR